MHLIRRMAPESNRRHGVVLAALACTLASGCASPLLPGWADFKANRDFEAAAADDSFPSAAEVGLASIAHSEAGQP